MKRELTVIVILGLIVCFMIPDIIGAIHTIADRHHAKESAAAYETALKVGDKATACTYISLAYDSSIAAYDTKLAEDYQRKMVAVCDK